MNRTNSDSKDRKSVTGHAAPSEMVAKLVLAAASQLDYAEKATEIDERQEQLAKQQQEIEKDWARMNKLRLKASGSASALFVYIEEHGLFRPSYPDMEKYAERVLRLQVNGGQAERRRAGKRAWAAHRTACDQLIAAIEGNEPVEKLIKLLPIQSKLIEEARTAQATKKSGKPDSTPKPAEPAATPQNLGDSGRGSEDHRAEEDSSKSRPTHITERFRKWLEEGVRLLESPVGTFDGIDEDWRQLQEAVEPHRRAAQQERLAGSNGHRMASA
jgi:hypothetical protein